MNGSELVGRVSRRTGLSRRAVRQVLDAALDEIASGLTAGERVTLSGFGTFDVREQAARTARHPKTGELLSVPARRAVVFRTGRDVRAVLRTPDEPTRPE
jgi:DNA-binding protein HU-beta